MMKFLIGFACVLSVASAQITIAGQCKDTPVVQKFDIPKYSGLWYEIYRYEFINELSADCVTANYKLKDGVVQVTNAMVLNGKYFDIVGIAEPVNATKEEAKLTVTFPESKEKGMYWVLATDYENYSLVYTCRNVDDNNKKISSWVLSRTKTLSPQAIMAINPYIDSSIGLAWDNYRQTSQTETACKY